MSKPTFYTDADSSHHAVVRLLRSYHVDVQTAHEAGLLSADDDRQIAHVLATGRILVTGDHRLTSRLSHLTRQGGHHSGVLFLPAIHRDKVGAIADSIRLVHEVCSAEEMVDRVEFIPF